WDAASQDSWPELPAGVIEVLAAVHRRRDFSVPGWPASVVALLDAGHIRWTFRCHLVSRVAVPCASKSDDRDAPHQRTRSERPGAGATSELRPTSSDSYTPRR